MQNYLKTSLWSLALILFTFMAVSCNDDDDKQPEKKKVYTLESVAGSGIAGTVTFEEAGSSLTTVTIELTGSNADSVHAAHIHKGVKGSGGEVAFPLANVVKSKSTTLVDATYDELLKYNGYVNVHASTMEVNPAVVATTNIGSNSK